ncbi:MAG TPA: hypothetical protein VEA81_08980 [Burkholderiaceae bacterium]|nr:hypothetical protein [Burkholderiaceae bacterium]
MASLNAFVSETLRQAIDALEAGIIWSRIAQCAFEAGLESGKDPNALDAEAIAARLRAAPSRRYAAGLEAGRAFASTAAVVDDFDFLLEFDLEGCLERFDGAGSGLAVERAAAAIAAGVGRTPAELFGAGDVALATLKGFLRGVREVWEQVRVRL